MRKRARRDRDVLDGSEAGSLAGILFRSGGLCPEV